MKKNFSSLSFFTIFSLALLMTTSTAAQEPTWLTKLKQQKWMKKVARLELLKTNRAEARGVLGEPEKSNFSDDESYISKNSTIDISYTTKACTMINGAVAKDTIEEIGFSFKEPISFSALKIPLEEFNRIPFTCTPGAEYRDEHNGVSFSVYEDDDSKVKKLLTVNFFIPERKNFSCVTVSTFLNDLDKVKNLKLLESNRADVGKIFAGYEKSRNFESSAHKDKYYTGDATIEIFYSQGKCLFDDSDEYDSPEWNVERITVSPNNHIFSQEFGINLAKYKKEQIYENRNDLYVYHDKDEGVSIEVVDGKIEEINFFPPQKYNSLICDKERAKILSATDSLFAENLKDRIHNPAAVASVRNVYLSSREIFASNNSDADQTSQSDTQKIIVFTRVSNPNNDSLTYSYTVSGGKITGWGEKIIWDLSGVKPGTYMITAVVDDGCGFCGNPASKTVVVK